MKRNSNIVLLLGLFAFSSVSCGNIAVTPQTVTPEISRAWQLTWLDQPICRPPCWQNITPGLTTRDEAVSILENMPGIKITDNGKYGLDWGFDSKAEGGTMRFSENDIVVSMRLGSINEDLQLKKVVEFYAFPEYVQPYDCRDGMCSTALIYPDLGMLLGVFVINENDNFTAPQIEILPETIVDRVYFTEPGAESARNLLRSGNMPPVMAWKGYGAYP